MPLLCSIFSSRKCSSFAFETSFSASASISSFSYKKIVSCERSHASKGTTMKTIVHQKRSYVAKDLTLPRIVYPIKNRTFLAIICIDRTLQGIVHPIKSIILMDRTFPVILRSLLKFQNFEIPFENVSLIASELFVCHLNHFLDIAPLEF